MGFGTLFIGYFLILNLTYYGFTDVIAAAVMLLGLYKLSSVNKQFRLSAIACGVFLAFSLTELGIAVYEMFVKQIDSPTFVSIMSAVRSLVLAPLSVFMLRGIESVAREVDIKDLSERTSLLSTASVIIYALWIILEAPLSFVNPYVLAILSLVTILATIALIILNLAAIYSAYMKICMPGDETPTDKPSRFSFVNEYRARKAERDEEATKERMKMLSERAEKRKGKKK